jgi:CelD/BcsL family acetyltransferase involved in cellulose biosynthesis
MGHVTFDIIAPQPTNVSALVKQAFAVEAAGWKRAAGTAIAVSRWRSAFYGRFAAYAAQEGILRLCFMRISGKVAAMQYAVECNGRFFDHKIGYDETFGSCSPGTLLKLEVLRYAAERGLRSYEFQGTDAPWTHFWTKFVRPMVSLKAYPANALGLWLFSHDKLNVKPRTPKKKSK